MLMIAEMGKMLTYFMDDPYFGILSTDEETFRRKKALDGILWIVGTFQVQFAGSILFFLFVKGNFWQQDESFLRDFLLLTSTHHLELLE